MATATAIPEVFTRKASGLVRVMSPYSAFVYNILTMGLIFPWTYLWAPGALPGGRLVWGILLAMLIEIPIAFAYVWLSTALPRSGGDYVFESRVFGGGQEQAIVLNRERQLESGWFELVADEHGGIGSVYRRAEQGVGHDVDERSGIETGFTCEGKCFGQRFDRRADHEVAGQFQRIGHRGRVPRDVGLLANRVEQRAASLDLRRRPRSDDEQLSGGRRVGAAEDRCSEVVLSVLAMRLSKPARECHADGAHRYVHGARLKSVNRAVQQDVLERAIVRDHRDRGFDVLHGLGGRRGNPRAECAEGLCPLCGAVVDSDDMPSLHQVPRDGIAHAAQADHGYVHVLSCC